MNELEKFLEAISNRSNLQEVRVVRPYPVEWNSAPYSPRFKAPNLHVFDGKGSLNQHIYYFKFQIGNVVSNDAIMARLFIGTLKGVTFWMVHEASCWLYQEIGWPRKALLSAILQRWYQSFRANSPCSKAEERRVNQNIDGEISEHVLRCPSSMTQSAPVETYRHIL